MDAAGAFKKIKSKVKLPVVADIHFDYKIALAVADSADCLRINPGNIGKAEKIREVINAAKSNDIPIKLVLTQALLKNIYKKYGELNSTL